MKNIKLVVSDLDGTLLNNNHQLNEETIDSVIKIQEAGLKFVVATGRNYYSLNWVIEKLQLAKFNGYLIASNGQQMYDFTSKSLMKADLIAQDKGFEVRQICKKNKVNAIIFYDDNIYCNLTFLTSLVIKFKFLLNKINKSVSEVGFQNYKQIKYSYKIARDVNKICILNSNKNKLKKIKKQVSNDFDFLSLSDSWHEIMPKNVNKGLMLDKIMAKENLNKEEVMVFGDGENDIEMLKRSDYSYVMANGRTSVKKYGNYIADKNSDNGVSVVLIELLKSKNVKI